jgi:hypothetical protein
LLSLQTIDVFATGSTMPNLSVKIVTASESAART